MTTQLQFVPLRCSLNDRLFQFVFVILPMSLWLLIESVSTHSMIVCRALLRYLRGLKRQLCIFGSLSHIAHKVESLGLFGKSMLPSPLLSAILSSLGKFLLAFSLFLKFLQSYKNSATVRCSLFAVRCSLIKRYAADAKGFVVLALPRQNGPRTHPHH